MMQERGNERAKGDKGRRTACGFGAPWSVPPKCKWRHRADLPRACVGCCGAWQTECLDEIEQTIGAGQIEQLVLQVRPRSLWSAHAFWRSARVRACVIWLRA